MKHLCENLLYQIVAKASNVRMKFFFQVHVLNLIYISTGDK